MVRRNRCCFHVTFSRALKGSLFFRSESLTLSHKMAKPNKTANRDITVPKLRARITSLDPQILVGGFEDNVNGDYVKRVPAKAALIVLCNALVGKKDPLLALQQHWNALRADPDMDEEIIKPVDDAAPPVDAQNPPVASNDEDSDSENENVFRKPNAKSSGAANVDLTAARKRVGPKLVESVLIVNPGSAYEIYRANNVPEGLKATVPVNFTDGRVEWKKVSAEEAAKAGYVIIRHDNVLIGVQLQYFGSLG